MQTVVSRVARPVSGKERLIRALLPRALFVVFMAPLIIAWTYRAGLTMLDGVSPSALAPLVARTCQWLIPPLFLTLLTAPFLIRGPHAVRTHIGIGIYLFGLQALIRAGVGWFFATADLRVFEPVGFERNPWAYEQLAPYIRLVGIFGLPAGFGLLLACHQARGLWVHSRRTRLGALLYAAGVMLSVLCTATVLAFLRGYYTSGLVRMESARLESIRLTDVYTRTWIEQEPREIAAHWLRGQYLFTLGRQRDAETEWNKTRQLLDAESEWEQSRRLRDAETWDPRRRRNPNEASPSGAR